MQEAPKPKILLVEDELQVRRGFTRLLGREGWSVVEAGDGEEARRALSYESFDVIATDIAMPGGGGIALLREVRKHDLDVPVILITGAPAAESAIAAVQHGAFDYLVKPVDHQHLIQTVARARQLHVLARAKRQALELLGKDERLVGDLAGLEASFDSAIAGLYMAYQPIVHARDRTLFGYEALLRSKEPSLPHPGAVLSAAERLGRLQQLGRVVRKRAILPFAESGAAATLFINLHPVDLLDPQLTSDASPMISFANQVVFEITERATLDMTDTVRSRVTELRRIGYRIAVDDLGAGYAGLTSFVQLEPDLVKLDMTLIRGVDESIVRQKLIRSITSVCSELGLMVIAEGVETPSERDTLVELGCDLLQGYLFARPGPDFPTFTWN